MKLQTGKRKKIAGHLVLICILFCLVLGITIASYLLLVQGQYTATIRSHNWNAAMVLAEAGVEDGMAFINKYAGNYGGSQNWADTAVADGWAINGNVYHTQRTPDATLGCYDVWITNENNSISVCAVGTVMWNQQPITGPQVPSAAPGVETSANGMGANVRQVLVQTTNDPLFSMAMAASGTINLNGNSISADSFDSSDPQHSVWSTNLQYGFYSPLLRKADGSLSTDGNILGAAQAGNTLVYGSVGTGPGGETNILQYGSVGDTNWVPTPGIQPGHGEDDMNVAFQTVQLPQVNWTPWSPLINSRTITNSGYYINADNGGLAHSVTITASNVVLYLSTGVNYGPYGPGGPLGESSGHHSITVASGSVTIYASGAVDLGDYGNIVNDTTNAANFYFYGLTNLTSLNLGTVPNFVGAIYAPQAALVLGNNSFPSQFTGSCIAQSITLNGNVAIHYDENLGKVGPARAFVPVSWTEF